MTAAWQTPVADANYVALVTDLSIVYTSLTAARTVTLPPVAQYPKNVRLVVADYSDNCSATDKITISGDGEIGGQSSFVLETAGAYIDIWTVDGVAWIILNQSPPLLPPKSMAYQDYDAVAITGGTIAGVTISGSVIDSGAATLNSGTLEGATISGCNIENSSGQGVWNSVSAASSSALKSTGHGIYITPNNSGNVFLSFSGCTTDQLSSQIFYGTGTKPSSGAAGGTAIGIAVQTSSASLTNLAAFSVSVVLTGLTRGTQYWIDLFCNDIGATGAAITGVLSAFEF